MTVLGIDSGGTKTICQLADSTGRVLAESRGPGANLQALGELEVEKVLHELVEDTLGPQPVRVDAICAGMAGVDRPDEGATIRAILRRIGHRARLLVVNDALIALEAALPGAPGIVLLAGTGSIAYGRDAHGRAARAGGWGYILGDEGSGYWLGRAALQAVVRAADGRGPATLLTRRLLDHYGIRRPQDLIHEIYDRTVRPTAVAALATLVDIAADEGDQVAVALLNQASDELASAAASVAAQLSLPAGPVITAGGRLPAGGTLAVRVQGRLAQALPGVDVRPLSVEPVTGAVRLAIDLANGVERVPVYLTDAS